MVYVRSRKFCCCLPVRFGVFVMSLAALLGGGLVAVAGWIEVKNLHDNPVSKQDEYALYIHAIMYSLLALIGAFGLYGTISKKIGLVSSFGSALAFHLGFSVVTGIYTIYTVFKRNSTAAMTNCVNGSTDQTVIDGCQNGLKIVKGLVIAIYVVTWIIELYGVIIINNYVRQLKEEELVQGTAVNPNAYIPNAPMTSYAPPAGPYAFTQPTQAMGNQV
ncbi:hypothetical protein B0H11DRAFT_2282809 [Mycena galericulata]|nr:hypothetical protein B0H11DRAFT_2282809 [Mycena galericulata]